MSKGKDEPAMSVPTHVKWLILVIASIGFAFDIYELLMLPLIARDAIGELLPKASIADRQMWRGYLFFVPALVGGVVGLWGGYLTDRLGRRSVLTWSILLYAFSAFFAGFSTNIYMLILLRCGCFIGVCVEFVAAVAWLAELFPDHDERERVLGYTQAFSSIGGLLVAVAFGICGAYGASFPAIAMPGFLAGLLGQVTEQGSHAAWRYTLMSGVIPAIPLILIRPFLPESPAWAAKAAQGNLRRPSIAELFSPELARTTIVTTLMFACSFGAAFGAIQQLQEITPGLKVAPEYQQAALDKAKKAGTIPEDPEKAKPVIAREKQNGLVKLNSEYTKVQEIGGLVGRFIFAFLATRILSQRTLLRLFQVPGLIVVPLVFWFFLTIPNTEYFRLDLKRIFFGEIPITTMSLGIFLCGLFTVAQFSFWGNYLPRVYPLHLRGTGESFAANIGGRMFGTLFAWVTTTIVGLYPRIDDQLEAAKENPYRYAVVAAGVALTVYVVGFLASFWLPEPKVERLDH